DVGIQPVDDGRDSDHRHHADHDAQHRQRRAQLVLAHGIERHLQVFGMVAALHRYSSDRNAVMGSSFAARCAGYTPKKTPTDVATSKPATTDHSSTELGMPISSVTVLAKPAPATTPRKPPTSAMV